MITPITENTVVDLTAELLTSEGWTVTSFCHGRARGHDVVAERNFRRIVIEAKGSIADKPDATAFNANKTRSSVDAAHAKASRAMTSDPDACRAIALPDTPLYRRYTDSLRDSLTNNDIRVIWVTTAGANWEGSS
jgi:hypothetical protein